MFGPTKGFPALLAVSLLSLCVPAAGQPTAQSPNLTSEDDFHVYRDAPRLTVTAQRTRLLRRERERRSPRWENFEALVQAGVPLDEPGFVWALYYHVSQHRETGRKAVQWAMERDFEREAGASLVPELRQVALVFDWCAPLLTGSEADLLAAKLQQGLRAVAAAEPDIPLQNARALAAIALADRLPDAGDSILRDIAGAWWRGQILPRLLAGQPVPRQHLYWLYEMLHAIRDNTQVDLRDRAPEYFKQLPLDYLAAHYPAPFPGPQNLLRIPVYVGNGDPEVAMAIRSRAAGLALVAYDTNGLNPQFVQGWLINDPFQMRDPLGASYEFLWANPYQPGLSYQTLPLVFHDPHTGHVFARTSWEDDATWIGYFEDALQLFQNNGVQTLRPGRPLPEPLHVGQIMLTRALEPESAQFQMDSETLFVLGLTPGARYGVEIDDRQLDIVETDKGGTLVVGAPERIDAGVRIRKRPL